MALAKAFLRAAGLLEKSLATEPAKVASSIATENAPSYAPSFASSEDYTSASVSSEGEHRSLYSASVSSIATEHAERCQMAPPSEAQSDGCDESSTATEHAMASSSIATEHARRCQMPPPIERHDGGDLLRFLLGDQDLQKIVALLVFMAKSFVQAFNISEDEIKEAAFVAILKHADVKTLLAENIVEKLSKVIDMILLHKDGSPKDPDETLAFMRRLARIREEVRFRSRDNATEHVELNPDEVSMCFRQFGREWLTNNLLQHQKEDTRYSVSEGLPNP